MEQQPTDLPHFTRDPSSVFFHTSQTKNLLFHSHRAKIAEDERNFSPCRLVDKSSNKNCYLSGENRISQAEVEVHGRIARNIMNPYILMSSPSQQTWKPYSAASWSETLPGPLYPKRWSWREEGMASPSTCPARHAHFSQEQISAPVRINSFCAVITEIWLPGNFFKQTNKLEIHFSQSPRIQKIQCLRRVHLWVLDSDSFHGEEHIQSNSR